MARNSNNDIQNKNGRVSTSPPPSLERKFELLEARFTQPIGFFGNTNNSNSNNHGASFSSPQEKSHNKTNIMNENSNLSEHSFSFSGGSSSNHSKPMMTIRSKKNSRNMTSLDIVSRAAAKHMRKVAANSPVNDTGIASSNFSFSSTSGNSNQNQNDSNNSNSQQTVVTGNRTNGNVLQQQQQPLSQQSQPDNMERVVAESPPVLISPAKASSNEKPRAARALQIKQDHPQPGSAGSSAVGLLFCLFVCVFFARE